MIPWATSDIYLIEAEYLRGVEAWRRPLIVDNTPVVFPTTLDEETATDTETPSIATPDIAPPDRFTTISTSTAPLSTSTSTSKAPLT